MNKRIFGIKYFSIDWFIQFTKPDSFMNQTNPIFADFFFFTDELDITICPMSSQGKLEWKYFGEQQLKYLTISSCMIVGITACQHPMLENSTQDTTYAGDHHSGIFSRDSILHKGMTVPSRLKELRLQNYHMKKVHTPFRHS